MEATKVRRWTEQTAPMIKAGDPRLILSGRPICDDCPNSPCAP